MPFGRRRQGSQSPDPGIATRRLLSTILESQHSAPGTATQSRPNVDPQQQAAASVFSLNTQPRWLIGTITDATALANCYRVQFEQGKQPLTGLLLSHTSLSAFGPRDMTTLQPGQAVLAMLHPHLQHAIILGALPSPNINPQNALATILLATTRSRVLPCGEKETQWLA